MKPTIHSIDDLVTLMVIDGGKVPGEVFDRVMARCGLVTVWSDLDVTVQDGLLHVPQNAPTSDAVH